MIFSRAAAPGAAVCACALVVVPCRCDDAKAYVPTSSNRLVVPGDPMSATFTLIVIVQGCVADGWAGQLPKKLFPLYEMRDVPDDDELFNVLFKPSPRPKLRGVSNGVSA